jgi:hypothetical protein
MFSSSSHKAHVKDNVSDRVASARADAEVETARAAAIDAHKAAQLTEVNQLKRRAVDHKVLEERAARVISEKLAAVKSGAVQPQSVDEILIARRAKMQAAQQALDQDEGRIADAVASHLSRQLFITGPNNEAVPLIVKPLKPEFKQPMLLWERNKRELISQGRYVAVPEEELRGRLQRRAAMKWGLLGRMLPFLARLDGKSKLVTNHDNSERSDADTARAAAAAINADPEAAAILTVEQVVQREMRAAMDMQEARQHGYGDKDADDGRPKPIQFPVRFFLTSVAIMIASYTGLTLYDYYMELNYGILPPGRDFD